MALVLIALDPDTDGGDCPAVFLDTDTGDLVVQGVDEEDPLLLSQIDGTSRIKPEESIVRLPSRMRAVLLRALLEVEGGGAQTIPTQ
ncbi:hypothetical protein [Actinomadura decatromicini]|uniref:Uncharacterized protein n=1 Tax=Actinomadura decatromicini TaxID=2604572 RepID=A0A5D3F5F0_9ACTN|nr:hypothetical protein [Actinomadura decatromicini]TYK43279.1 hypothetical protein FXF68_39380 [Actinomadura decatromicini]